MSVSFEQALGDGIKNDPDANPFYADRITALLASPDSLRKRVVMRMLERHAVAHIEGTYGDSAPRDETGAIDWSKIDWASVLTTLLKILVALLPLLML
jgi:hypothetical protein